MAILSIPLLSFKRKLNGRSNVVSYKMLCTLFRVVILEPNEERKQIFDSRDSCGKPLEIATEGCPC